MAVKWTTNQQRVIDSRKRNLLVSAAAGSGKTAVLVERIIRMISEGEHPLNIDQLLVMTFTNAAAAEMRERINAAVDKLLTERPEDEHLWLQGALIPQAQITTIDSFCLNLIRSHYNTLDIDPGFRIGDVGELSLLRADVMQEMLEEQYQNGGESFFTFVEQFGRGKSDAGIEDVILQAWQFSQSHPWPMEWMEHCRAELLAERLDQMESSGWMQFVLGDVRLQMEELALQLGEALDVCREENGPLAYEPMLAGDKRQIESILAAAAQGTYEGLYRGFQNISFDRLAAIRSKEIDAEKKAYVSACRDRAKKAVAKCREAYASQSPEEMTEAVRGTGEVLSTLLDLTREFDRCYREKKKDRNVLDFNDLEHLALEVLLEEEPGAQETPSVSPSSRRRPTAVADELSRQFEEILVDEYQDSNYVQEALITSISRERHGCPNVFMVGDVKQSIYRFRLARPELFMDKYERYTAEDSPYQKIELHQNFRSRATVLDSVNDIFYKIMTKPLGGIRYSQETALHPGAVFAPRDRAGTPTELLMADTGADALKQLDEEAMDYTARELEARLAAIRIRELLDEEKGLMVWDQDKEKYRPVRLGDIVILLRSLSGWSEVFVNVLMNEGIPAYAQTKTGYFNTVEVETVLSLLAVVDNPIQDIPLSAVMKSPIIAMNDEEMAWLMSVYKQAPEKGQDRGIYGAWMMWKEGRQIGTPVPDGLRRSVEEKLGRLETLLEGLRRESKNVPVHQLLYRVFEVSGYYDYVSAMPAGETRRANLDMLVEKAIAYEATSYKGLFHFIRYIEKLKKFDTDFGEASVAGGQADTVRIMSIHKSKGLEFPVVFLAGMGKRFNKQDAFGQILMDADLGLGADCLDLTNRLRIPTLKKQALKRRMELESMGEELRVLYVAMTRAKEKLIMTATDRSLGTKLEKWRQIPTTEGRIPYTILSSAGSCLDWLLMSASSGSIVMRQVPIAGLLGMEIQRQESRRATREDLLKPGAETAWDRQRKEQLDAAFCHRYPYAGDTELYAMLSVSELKKQGQTGQDEEEIGRLALRPAPDAAISGAARGTAYHRALECLDLTRINSLQDTARELESLLESGYLEQEAYDALDARCLWSMLQSPLGRRMTQALAQGRLHRERQFIIGIPADELGKGVSKELLLVQGVIDAYIEEQDGLVLIDYKTDRVQEGKKGETVLAERYRFQMDCYRRALEQLTEKKVKENMIYSLTLQKSIRL